MSATSPDRLVLLDDHVPREEVEAIDTGALLALNPVGRLTAAEVHARLAGRHPALAVYLKADVPAALRYGSHPRVPAIIGLVEPGWLVTRRTTAAEWARSGRMDRGAHGYDPRHRDMHGLFVAAGPAVRRGHTAPTFDSVHVYEFLCRLLGLAPAANDGDPAVTAAFFSR
jgi:hypothetical protein